VAVNREMPGLSRNVPKQTTPRWMALKCVFGLACLLLPIGGSTTSPATREQILCAGSTEVVIAEVLGGYGADCRLKGSSDCMPQDVVHLSIRIKQVLGVGNGARVYDVGELVQVSTIAAQVERPELSVDLVPAGNLLVVPALGRPLSDDDVAKLFVGKKYIFAMRVLPESPFWASTWDMQREEWVRATLRRADENRCPKLVSTIKSRALWADGYPSSALAR
jgi:hypothetical protein